MNVPPPPTDPADSTSQADPFIDAVRTLVIQITVALSVIALYLVCVNYYAVLGLQPICVPITGFAVAALLLRHRQVLAGIFAGLLLARIFFSTDPIWIVVLLTWGNFLEVMLAIWLLRVYHFTERGLDTAKGLMMLCLISMLVPAVSCLFLALGHWLHPAAAASVALAAFNGYWLADAVSTVQAVCFSLLWLQPPYPWKQPDRAFEGVLWLAAACLIGQIIFLGWFPGTFGVVTGGYWMFLVVLPVAVRIGCHGVIVVQMMAAIQGMTGAALGLGFLSGDMHKTHMVNLWSYIGILTLVGMAFAIVLRSRISNENQLRQSRRARVAGWQPR